MKRILFLLLYICTLTATAQSLQDTLGLRSFMDGVMETHLRDRHIAGATLAIVHGGKVIYAKGYGFADLATQRPVSPDTTLFRIGSVSKLLVWTSVMQLAAQGKLNLDQDINTYLKDFKIPDQYDQPITLRDIMTHTAGFEDHLLNLFAHDSSAMAPLGKILARQLPARVRPPYIHASYSNHATGIAAYLVELASGMSFEEYAKKNIFIPLNMQFTTLSQPLPALLRKDISSGYQFKDNRFEKKEFEFVPLYPVGAVSASAMDMTHLIMAYLQHGRYQSVQLLDSAVLQHMMGSAYQAHTHVNPMRHGFIDMSQNGVTVLGHGGATFWFHSMLAFLPQHNTGIFLSFNTDTGSKTGTEVLEQFMDRYFPDTRPLPTPIHVDKNWLSRFAGEYKSNRYPHTDFTKISSLFGRVKITVKDSAHLEVATEDKRLMFVPIDSTTFREENNNNKIAFAKDEQGAIRYMFLGSLPAASLEKVTAADDSSFQNNIFMLAMIVTIIALIYWPLVSRLRRHYQPHISAKTTLPISGRVVAWSNFLFLFIFTAGLLMIITGPEAILYGVPTSLKVLLALPVAMIVTTILMVIYLVQIIRDSRYRFWSRMYYLLLVIVSATALWQIYYWNFLGWNY